MSPLTRLKQRPPVICMIFGLILLSLGIVVPQVNADYDADPINPLVYEKITPKAWLRNPGEDYFFYNQKNLESIGPQYETMATLRENRKNLHRNTLNDEVNFYNQNQSLVQSYIKSTARNHFMGWTRTVRKSLQEDVKTSRRESAKLKNRPTTMKVTSTDKTFLRKKKLSDAKTAKSKMEPVTETTSSETGDADIAVEQVISSAWKVGQNIIEDRQLVPITDDAEARLHFDLPRTTMHMDFVSNIIQGDVTYRVGKGYLPLSGRNDPFLGDRTTLGISRGFEEFTLSTSLRYGLDSNRMNYGVNKRIHGPLSAGVDRTEALRNKAENNTSVHVDLGFNF